VTGSGRLRLALLPLLLAGALAACTPKLAPPGPGGTEPHLELAGLTGARAAAAFVAGDGLALPLRAWLPEQDGEPRPPRAVILALHGFNDHSGAFEEPAPTLAARGFAVYAYDQRGFGAGENVGLWAGGARLAEDARQALALLAARHPGKPLYLLGESMGGAVALLAAGGPGGSALPDSLRGLVLSAPAVWSSDLQPWYQRWALWLTVRLVPGLRPSGRGTGIQASDNLEALRALGRDPLVIKYSRIDTIQGLVELMGSALDAAPAVRRPVLLLYGEHDELIPERPVEMLWAALPAHPESRLVVYPEGWHMLLRDLQARVVLADIAAWIEHPGLTPPSITVGLAEPDFEADR
jgi:alpha-beta hydrolase superfamily lysophospholipase